MTRFSRQGPRQLRIAGLAATTLLLVSVAAAPASSAAVPSTNCAASLGAGDNFQELCLTEAQLTAMDDAGVNLGTDEISSSPNLHQLANIPKQGPFADESALDSDLAF